jgi:hypothetical protein
MATVILLLVIIRGDGNHIWHAFPYADMRSCEAAIESVTKDIEELRTLGGDASVQCVYQKTRS